MEVVRITNSNSSFTFTLQNIPTYSFPFKINPFEVDSHDMQCMHFAIDQIPVWDMNSSVEAVWAAQDSKKKKFEYFLATFFEGGFFIFTCMATESFVFAVVLDQRLKFYGRSRRFKTYGYGYGGQSLRPFLRPKVFLLVSLVFFSKMEAEMCFSLHRCHLRLMWNMILLLSSLKIKTGPFLMKFL